MIPKRKRTPRKDYEVEDDILRIVLTLLEECDESDGLTCCEPGGWATGIDQAIGIVKGTMHIPPFEVRNRGNY